MNGEYSVYQWFADDSCEKVVEFTDAEHAVTVAGQLARSVGGRLGTTRHIMITDGDDFCVFEWRYGRGVVFPPECAQPGQAIK